MKTDGQTVSRAFGVNLLEFFTVTMKHTEPMKGQIGKYFFILLLRKNKTYFSLVYSCDCIST